MDQLAGEPRKIPDGLLQRIRWANVARLAFVVVIAAVLAEGLPSVGGEARPAPDLGLPESVLRPPAPVAAPTSDITRPPPLKRTSPETPLKRASARRSVRRPSKRPRPAPRAADATTGYIPAAPAYVTPPPVGPSAVGEFGP
jgi:hypothetical protein